MNGDNIVSGKTGQLIKKGKCGKLFPPKKVRPPQTVNQGSPQATTSTVDDYNFSNNVGINEYGSHTPDRVPVVLSSPSNLIENSLGDDVAPSNVSPDVSHLSQDSKPYSIVEHRRRLVKKFNVDEMIFKVKFTNQWTGRTIYDMLDDFMQMFDDILNQVRDMYDPGVRARIYINHPDLQYEKPIFIALRPIHLLTPQAILAAIEKVLNSNSTLKIDGLLQIHIGILDIHRGGGYSKLKHKFGKDTFLQKLKKTSILNIERRKSHPTCAARAIICGAARLRCNKYEYKMVSKKSRGVQYKLASILLKKIGLPNDRELTIAEFHKIETYLQVQVIVYDAPFRNSCIYSGSAEMEDKIFLYHSENHFDLIASITGFLSTDHYCTTCKCPYKSKTTHKCFIYCKTCEHLNCEVESKMTCINCFQVCRNVECFNRHKDSSGGTKSLCDKLEACKKCRALLMRESSDNHVCGEYKCHNCNNVVSRPHLCYMRAQRPPKTSGKFIYFDFETTAENRQECSKGYQNQKNPFCTECYKLGTDCIECCTCANCGDATCHTMVHNANLVVAQTICNFCQYDIVCPESKCMHCGSKCESCCELYDDSPKYDCTTCPDGCGNREIIFSGENTAYNFVSCLLSDCFHGFTFISHNGGSFDNVIILEKILNNFCVKVDTIYRGAKIVSMKIPEYKIRFIDSMSFLPMALKKLTSAFDLNSKKGDFPHFFNVSENFDYIGPMPDIKYYAGDSMSPEARGEFLKWYNLQEGKIFDFQKEILSYCRSDVAVLREACTKFRDLVMQTTATNVEVDENGLINYIGAVDPFACSTLAGLCLSVFRSKFLKEKYKKIEIPLPPQDNNEDNEIDIPQDDEEIDITPTCEIRNKKKMDKIPTEKYVFESSQIGILPEGGYANKDTFSKTSILWLELYGYRNRVHINHALNGGEFKIPGTNYRVDGYIADSNTVLEFLGDFYHGCPYHTNNFAEDGGGIKAEQRYAMTIDRLSDLRKRGYTVIEKWECVFARDMDGLTDDEKTFLDRLDLVERLDPRDAFYGGRCNAIKLHSAVVQEYQIKYLDVRSMYPEAMKTAIYPEGHPDIIVSNFQEDVTEYFGLIKLRVLPPRDLYHPVLPYKCRGKLMFVLCRFCAENENYVLCNCSDSERSFVGTFITLEVIRGVEAGYKILKIFEVYHYESYTQYSPETMTGGIFAEYVDTFVKLKTEASGYPSWCISEADKEKYIQNFYEHEGIRLDAEKIKYNPGLRLIAKAFLNNLWGRLGLRDNLPKTTFLRSPESFFEIVNDASNDITDFHIVTDDVIALTYEKYSDAIPMNNSTNVILAAFTTCHGRLHLLDYMTSAGKSLLYTDTDSLFKISHPSRPDLDPPVGDYLGDLTSELQPGEHIVEFASSGAKSYVFETNTGRKECKLKGFSLNYQNSLLINFEVMRDMVLNQNIQGNDELKTVITINKNKITRDKYKCKIYNKKEIKRYKAVYNKRIIMPDLTTVPFGYDFSQDL